MGMQWVRLDCQFATNPKMLELIAAKRFKAAFAYVAALAYAGAHGTDGYIPESGLMFVHATRAEAAALVEAGLWRPSRNGWDINGWSEFQISDETARMRRERAQKGGLAKAEKARQAALRSV